MKDLYSVEASRVHRWTSAGDLGIELDDVLAKSKLLLRPGCRRALPNRLVSPGARWPEWNGKYCDAIRVSSYLLSDQRSCIKNYGSSDSTMAPRRTVNSINFITAHDGFTLWT